MIEYENNVGKIINKLRSLCNSFIYTFGIVCKENEKEDQLLLEYVYPGKTYGSYLKEVTNFSKVHFVSELFQIIMALQIAQEKCNFTHYDLTCENVLYEFIDCCDVSKNEEVIYEYEIDEYDTYKIPVRINLKIFNFGKAHVTSSSLQHFDIEVINPKDTFSILKGEKESLENPYYETNNSKFDASIDLQTFINSCLLNLKLNPNVSKEDFEDLLKTAKNINVIKNKNPAFFAFGLHRNFINEYISENSNNKKIFYWKNNSKRSNS